jgi:hypothetical protein
MVSHVLMTWVQIGGGIVGIIGLFYLSVWAVPEGSASAPAVVWCSVVWCECQIVGWPRQESNLCHAVEEFAPLVSIAFPAVHDAHEFCTRSPCACICGTRVHPLGRRGGCHALRRMLGARTSVTA